MNRLRTIAAFLVAPLTPAALLVAGILVVEDVGGPGRAGLVIVIRVAAIAAYALTLLLGVPAFVLFRRRGWTSVRAHLAAGVVIGLVAWILFRLAGITRADPGELAGLAIFVGFAVPSTLVFRAVAGGGPR